MAAGNDPVPPGPVDLPDIACFVVDGAGRVAGWSRHAEDLFGWSAQQMAGQPVSRIVDWPPPTTAAAPGSDPAPGNGAAPESVTAVGRHRDGRELRVALRATPMAGDAGGALTVLSVLDLDTAPWWTVSASVLERFLGRMPYGLAVLGTDLRYTWVNRTLEDMAAVPLEERIGRRVGEALPDLDAEGMEGQLRHTLSTGTAIRGFEYRGFTPADPEREHVYATSFFRLDDEAGRVLGVGYMGTDVTDRQRAQERFALLTDSAETIGSSLDLARTADELAAAAAPGLADMVAVDLFERILGGGEPGLDPEREAGSLVRVAHRSLRPGCPEALVALGEPSRYGRNSSAMRALRERRALLDADLAELAASWPGEDDERSDRARAYRFRSMITVPITARGLYLGVAVFLREAGRERFEEADLRLAEEFVARVAVALDNARRYTREHTASLTLQRSLLPRTSAGGTSLEVAARYRPAGTPGGVGGDWFDIIPLSAGRCALVVGDVVGRGVAAAAAMGRLRMAVRTLAAMDPSPEELLARLDDLVLRLIAEDEEDAESGRSAGLTVLGATCLYAVYDPVLGRMSVARAGHPAPLVVGADGTVALAEVPAGPPLGLGALPFEAGDIVLAEGGAVALYTNGLLSAWGRDPDLGLDRFRAELRDAGGQPLEPLCDRLLDRLQVRESPDDAALVLARPRPLGPDRVASWDLPSDPAVVGSARALVSGVLTEWGLEEQVFVAELVVSELVTNAIRYGRAPVRLRVVRHDAVTFEVFDASATAPRLRHARITDEGGRGLFLIAQMAARWGARYVPDGKIVWAELAAEPG
ncbi:SpoIIE family protein phosphatase [Kitasatospora sp. NPDC048239]|uniref:SpoIIE family protein phosphatase n=1 Tax=Kitasatospora sp. NPDC048239 TaxID=3364046 RepID=UPI003716B595